MCLLLTLRSHDDYFSANARILSVLSDVFIKGHFVALKAAGMNVRCLKQKCVYPLGTIQLYNTILPRASMCNILEGETVDICHYRLKLWVEVVFHLIVLKHERLLRIICWGNIIFQ